MVSMQISLPGSVQAASPVLQELGFVVGAGGAEGEDAGGGEDGADGGVEDGAWGEDVGSDAGAEYADGCGALYDEGAAGAWEVPEPPPPAAQTGSASGYGLPSVCWTTYLPGLGNLTLVCSAVAHLSLPTDARLATKSSGRSSISLPSPPLIWVCMQFEYISRFPMVLNHVHCKIAWPSLTPLGSVKGKELTQLVPSRLQAIAWPRLPGASVGHPPSIE